VLGNYRAFPPRVRKPRLASEASSKGASGKTRTRRQFVDAGGSRGPRQHALSRFQQTGASWHGYLELFRRRLRHLGSDHIPQQMPHRTVARHQLSETLERRGHQFGCAQYAYTVGQTLKPDGRDQHTSRTASARSGGMTQVRRHPRHPTRGNHPGAVLRVQARHAGFDKDELALRVSVPRCLLGACAIESMGRVSNSHRYAHQR
jgi:hypothetical protein